MSKKVSVVIPTLGGSQIIKTLNQLNKGSLRPNEIILSTIGKIKLQNEVKKIRNVKIIRSNKKGQVSQRIKGFKLIKNNYVLQIDDDILLEKNCLKKLVNFLALDRKKKAVSPLLITQNRSSNFDKKPKNFFYKFYHFILNGKKNFQSGKISKAGIPYYFDNKRIKGLINVEWLSGGCILHRKENLILKNYFPILSKKAYCEDLIHSEELKKKKINLYLNTEALAYYNDFEGFKSIKSDYICRSYFIKISKKSFLRMNFYYLILFMRFFIAKIYI